MKTALSPRTLLPSVMAAAALLAGVNGVNAATRATPGDEACSRVLLPGDRHEFTCALPAAPQPRKLRFVVELSGGHDDSMSSLAVRLGEQQLPCGPGSKTDSNGEDGDIMLQCRFTVPATASPQDELRVSLKASHVNLERHRLLAD